MYPASKCPDDHHGDRIDNSHNDQLQAVNEQGAPLVDFRGRVCPPVDPHKIPVHGNAQADDRKDQFHPAIRTSKDALFCIVKGIF